MQQFHSSQAAFLCSCDISSLFSDTLSTETIQICAYTPYSRKLVPVNIPTAELLNVATVPIEFSFNDTMY